MNASRKYYTCAPRDPETDRPQDMLMRLLTSSLNEMRIAEAGISARALIDFAQTAHHVSDPKRAERETAFNVVINRADWREYELRNAYTESNMPPHSELNSDEAVFGWINSINENIPERDAMRRSRTFFVEEYINLDNALRAFAEIAFSGLMFTAVSDPDFAALCADKTADAAAMTLEQKLDAPLDHQALYAYAQAKLAAA